MTPLAMIVAGLTVPAFLYLLFLVQSERRQGRARSRAWRLAPLIGFAVAVAAIAAAMLDGSRGP